ncbi:MAG: TetR/AcrR family transcriptional regulator [Lachnospiraceae bacterium]|nr:TetR/AcrR family transcriptional regulator [Lachnospiraceae bacterium]
MNKSESKYFNTAAKMDEALISLLEKKDFEYITIKEICVLAGVNRSTFYLHYETTRDLLIEALEYINVQFLGYFTTDAETTIEKIKSGKLEELIFITPCCLTPYLEFIKDHKRLFAAALTRPESFHSYVSFEKMFEYLFNPIMERFRIPKEERSYMLAFYIKGIMGIVTEWLRKDCAESVEVITGFIIKYALPTEEISG